MKHKKWFKFENVDFNKIHFESAMTDKLKSSTLDPRIAGSSPIDDIMFAVMFFSLMQGASLYPGE